MSFRILVMGLSGSGKTTLSGELINLLDADYLNADEIRKETDDWDFSKEGRVRQAKRINELSLQSSKEYVVMDFICPLEESRDIVNADCTIWMDTVKSSKYSDTDNLFQAPKNTHRVKGFAYNVKNIIKGLKNGST
jgi:adenylylsulfate kinase